MNADDAEFFELVNQGMAEEDLRKELAKLGIGTDGERATLVERLTQAQQQQEDLGVVEMEAEEGGGGGGHRARSARRKAS